MKRHRKTTEFIRFNPQGCLACRDCIEACPRQVIGMVKFLWHSHAVLSAPEACIGCGKCIRICPRNRFKRL